MRLLPIAPFRYDLSGATLFSSLMPCRTLDAPNLRNDFYCSVLAYSASLRALIVGLGNTVYTWSEKDGARAVNGTYRDGVWLTSLSFSSIGGEKNIFAAGRSDGTFILMSLLEPAPRFCVQQQHPIACLSWRPHPVLRYSRDPSSTDTLVDTEDLIVSDEHGNLYYYLVEWSKNSRNLWPGSVSLVTRISLHTRQICGLAWSPDGGRFASGANDNLCFLFEVKRILHPRHMGITPNHQLEVDGLGNGCNGSDLSSPQRFDQKRVQTQVRSRQQTDRPLQNEVHFLTFGCQSHMWVHRAAVKAIAFCP